LTFTQILPSWLAHHPGVFTTFHSPPPWTWVFILSLMRWSPSPRFKGYTSKFFPFLNSSNFFPPSETPLIFELISFFFSKFAPLSKILLFHLNLHYWVFAHHHCNDKPHTFSVTKQKKYPLNIQRKTQTSLVFPFHFFFLPFPHPCFSHPLNVVIPVFLGWLFFGLGQSSCHCRSHLSCTLWGGSFLSAKYTTSWGCIPFARGSSPKIVETF